MSFNVSISNHTEYPIVANGTVILPNIIQQSQSYPNLIIQIPNQAVIEMGSSSDSLVEVTSSYYKTTIENTGASISLVVNQDFTFSVEYTPIQNVPIQTNRIGRYPFFFASCWLNRCTCSDNVE